MRELLAAAGHEVVLAALYGEQRAADDEPQAGAPGFNLEEPSPPEYLRPWREVCEPHPGAAAFSRSVIVDE